MHRILIIVAFFIVSNASGQSIGVKIDYMDYTLKHQYGYKANSGASYSLFYEHYYRPLVSFGIEGGGYKFEFDKNRSTNLFIKPTIILTGQIGKNVLAIHGGFSFDVSIDHSIGNSYVDYINESDSTKFIRENSFFYNSFASFCAGASYTREVGKFGVGIKFETQASQGGFYKGYESNFKRIGLFVKYKI